MDNAMHIIKVAVPILFGLIVLIILWTLIKAARKKIKDTQLTMAAMVAAKRSEAPEEKGAGRQYFLTFQVANGTHMEFAVTRNVYAHLAVDDVGQLTFKRTEFVGFKKTGRAEPAETKTEPEEKN